MNISKIIHSKFFSFFFPRLRPYSSYFDYYENIVDQINFSNLKKGFSDSSINDINTSKEISFFGMPFNTNLKETIKKNGTPRFKYKHTQISNLTGVFYRKKLGNSKVTAMLIFLNNKFILGSYIFDSCKVSTYCEIANQINLKYLNGIVSDKSNHEITDTNLNRIEIVHSVDYRINFISGDRNILKTINEQMELTIQTSYEKVNLAILNFI